jgi:hypothetical protein
VQRWKRKNINFCLRLRAGDHIPAKVRTFSRLGAFLGKSASSPACDVPSGGFTGTVCPVLAGSWLAGFLASDSVDVCSPACCRRPRRYCHSNQAATADMAMVVHHTHIRMRGLQAAFPSRGRECRLPTAANCASFCSMLYRPVPGFGPCWFPCWNRAPAASRAGAPAASVWAQSFWIRKIPGRPTNPQSVRASICGSYYLWCRRPDRKI